MLSVILFIIMLSVTLLNIDMLSFVTVSFKTPSHFYYLIQSQCLNYLVYAISPTLLSNYKKLFTWLANYVVYPQVKVVEFGVKNSYLSVEYFLKTIR